MLENVQHKFTSRIREYQTWDDEQNMYTCTVDYWDRLKDLRTYSLEGEAKGTVILYAYMVIIGLANFQWFDAYMVRGIKLKPKYNRRAPAPVRDVDSPVSSTRHPSCTTCCRRR